VNIALIEPYYGGSHQAWADGYQAHSTHDVRLVTHAARFWKWRMHGSFLTLAAALEHHVEGGWTPDVVLASSMMDVAAFAGAIRRTLPSVPIATYFHESQFTYPLSPADKVDFTYQMKNWGSAAVSDLVIFNSEFHRSVFFEKARLFLNAFPEDKHVHLIQGIKEESVVLPVGVELSDLGAVGIYRGDVPLIVWNQRWEHDKGPEELKAIMSELIARDVVFSVAMCGEVFVSVPSTFAEVVDLLGDRLVHHGYAERSRYEQLLQSAAVVLSTADQEFFGIGVVEAIAAGAYPVLPDRLVYPERIAAIGADPAATLFTSASEAADLIEAVLPKPADSDMRSAVMQYDWSVVGPSYDESLEALVATV